MALMDKMKFWEKKGSDDMGDLDDFSDMGDFGLDAKGPTSGDQTAGLSGTGELSPPGPSVESVEPSPATAQFGADMGLTPPGDMGMHPIPRCFSFFSLRSASSASTTFSMGPWS